MTAHQAGHPLGAALTSLSDLRALLLDHHQQTIKLGQYLGYAATIHGTLPLTREPVAMGNHRLSLLQQHAGWILNISLEGLEELRADRTINHAVVNGQGDGHHRANA